MPPEPEAIARLEISNGDGRQGLARLLSRQLRDPGLKVVRLTNEKGFGVRQTRVEYHAAFRAAWAEALAEAYRNLELMMLERAMNGTVKTVTRADGSIDRTHEYPNAIALTLLRLHRDSAAAAEEEAEASEADVEELRARILRRIQRLRALDS